MPSRYVGRLARLGLVKAYLHIATYLVDPNRLSRLGQVTS